MQLLHDLIKSMTAAEKGYFKKQTAGQKQPDYVKMFDTIANMPAYDEKLLIKNLRNDRIARNAGRIKNYLYHVLIKTLVNYHHDASPKIAIRRLLDEAEMLSSRGMIKHARICTDKALALAETGEWFPEWVAAITIKGRLRDMHAYPESETKTMDLNNDVDNVLFKMQNLYDLIRLNREQESISNPSLNIKKQVLKKKLTEIKRHKLLRTENKAPSLKAKLLFNYISYFNRILLEDYKPAFEFAQRYQQILKANDAFTRQNHTLLMESYNMIITSLQFLQQPDLLEKYLNNLRDENPQDDWTRALRFQYYSGSALWFYTLHNRKKDFMQVAATILGQINTHKSMMKDDLRLGIYVTIAGGYLKFGHYTEAIDVIELYRNKPPKNVRHDYQNYLMFYYLIAQYERGSYKLVSSLIANMSRYMKRTDEFGMIEKTVMQIFDTCLKTPDKRTLKISLEDLLIKIKLTAEQDGAGRLYNYVNIVTPFCQARIKGRKYHECA